MKNLLIYISPTGSFDNPRPDLADNDAAALVKIQIENSLLLGWKTQDIVLVTNFRYKYGGVEALMLRGVEFFERKPQVSKINAIVKLFEKGYIKGDETYWFHDLDAFQLQPIQMNEINIDADQIAMTDFGGAKHFGGEDRWSGGIIYFKSGSYDIFQSMQKLCYEKQIDEEEAVGLTVINNPNFRRRIIKLNNSYNFIGYNLESVYAKSIKPLKVVHFHPRTGKKRFGGVGTESALRFFKGENSLNTPLITDNLLKLFEYHRIA